LSRRALLQAGRYTIPIAVAVGIYFAKSVPKFFDFLEKRSPSPTEQTVRQRLINTLKQQNYFFDVIPLLKLAPELKLGWDELAPGVSALSELVESGQMITFYDRHSRNVFDLAYTETTKTFRVNLYFLDTLTSDLNSILLRAATLLTPRAIAAEQRKDELANSIIKKMAHDSHKMNPRIERAQLQEDSAAGMIDRGAWDTSGILRDADVRKEIKEILQIQFRQQLEGYAVLFSLLSEKALLELGRPDLQRYLDMKINRAAQKYQWSISFYLEKYFDRTLPADLATWQSLRKVAEGYQNGTLSAYFQNNVARQILERAPVLRDYVTKVAQAETGDRKFTWNVLGGDEDPATRKFFDWLRPWLFGLDRSDVAQTLPPSPARAHDWLDGVLSVLSTVVDSGDPQDSKSGDATKAPLSPEAIDAEWQKAIHAYDNARRTFEDGNFEDTQNALNQIIDPDDNHLSPLQRIFQEETLPSRIMMSLDDLLTDARKLRLEAQPLFEFAALADEMESLSPNNKNTLLFIEKDLLFDYWSPSGPRHLDLRQRRLAWSYFDHEARLLLESPKNAKQRHALRVAIFGFALGVKAISPGELDQAVDSLVERCLASSGLTRQEWAIEVAQECLRDRRPSTLIRLLQDGESRDAIFDHFEPLREGTASYEAQSYHRLIELLTEGSAGMSLETVQRILSARYRNRWEMLREELVFLKRELAGRRDDFKILANRILHYIDHSASERTNEHLPDALTIRLPADGFCAFFIGRSVILEAPPETATLFKMPDGTMGIERNHSMDLKELPKDGIIHLGTAKIQVQAESDDDFVRLSNSENGPSVKVILEAPEPFPETARIVQENVKVLAAYKKLWDKEELLDPANYYHQPYTLHVNRRGNILGRADKEELPDNEIRVKSEQPYSPGDLFINVRWSNKFPYVDMTYWPLRTKTDTLVLKTVHKTWIPPSFSKSLNPDSDAGGRRKMSAPLARILVPIALLLATYVSALAAPYQALEANRPTAAQSGQINVKQKNDFSVFLNNWNNTGPVDEKRRWANEFLWDFEYGDRKTSATLAEVFKDPELSGIGERLLAVIQPTADKNADPEGYAKELAAIQQMRLILVKTTIPPNPSNTSQPTPQTVIETPNAPATTPPAQGTPTDKPLEMQKKEPIQKTILRPVAPKPEPSLYEKAVRIIQSLSTFTSHFLHMVSIVSLWIVGIVLLIVVIVLIADYLVFRSPPEKIYLSRNSNRSLDDPTWGSLRPPINTGLSISKVPQDPELLKMSKDLLTTLDPDDLASSVEAERKILDFLIRIHVLPQPEEEEVLSVLGGINFLLFEKVSGKILDMKERFEDVQKLVDDLAHLMAQKGLDLKREAVLKNFKGFYVTRFEHMSELSGKPHPLPRFYVLQHVEEYFLRYLPRPISNAEASERFGTALEDFVTSFLPEGSTLVVMGRLNVLTDRILYQLGYRDILPTLLDAKIYDNLQWAAQQLGAYRGSRLSLDDDDIEMGGFIKVFRKNLAHAA